MITLVTKKNEINQDVHLSDMKITAAKQYLVFHMDEEEKY